MSSRSRRRKAVAAPLKAPDTQPSIWEIGLSNRSIALAIACAVLAFYWVPLFDSAASIQWDAVDIHYSVQKYFSGSLLSGHLPFWTPYVFSGMPFLADPQVGAWYPLNWPFFLTGITPRAIQQETALHCFIAAFGAFLLGRELLGGRWSAVFCGAFYALSGFFTGHSSHVGVFQAAALFPWLLWAGLLALRSLRWMPVVALLAGLIVLVGHFQTALYAFSAFALLIGGEAVVRRPRLHNAALVLVCAGAGAAAIPAIMTLPGLELTAQATRASSDYTQNANAVLVPEALLTLVSPDHYHAPEAQTYTGPQDVTQFYFYGGILLLPLAIAGLVRSRRHWHGIVLIVPALWYALGPSGLFYSLASRLPGLRSVRSPVNDWFIVALGLALLAAAGVTLIRRHLASPWIPILLLMTVFGDLWYWNMNHNRLAYARDSFENLYGDREEQFRNAVVSSGAAQPLARIWAPSDSPGFGPLNGSLDNRIEVTYGYNVLALTRYSGYLDKAAANPRLLDSLAATAKLDPRQGRFLPNRAALPRVSIPAAVITANQDQSARALSSLDPAKEALAEGITAIPHNGPAAVNITNYENELYRIQIVAPHPALVRLAVPYFPGWLAEIDGQPTKVIPVDLALMGVVVPAGTHAIVFHYHSNFFLAGALISGLSAIGVLVWLAWSFRSQLHLSPPVQAS